MFLKEAEADELLSSQDGGVGEVFSLWLLKFGFTLANRLLS